MYSIENNQLVIRLDLKQQKFNPYMDESTGETDNVCGILDEQDIGFGFLVDREYKGKSPDCTGILFHWLKSQDEFEEFCKTNGISIITYATLSTK